MKRAILFRTAGKLAVASAFAASLQASAGEWQIKPRIEVREAFTDNVLLTSRNKKSDFLTTVSPGISVSGQGARMRFDVDYALSYDVYARESSINGFRQDLRGLGNVTLVPDNFFIDLSAFAGQSPGLSRGVQSAIDRRTGSNQSQFYSYSASPYWRGRFGSWANSEARYRFSQNFSRSNTSVTTQNTLSDALTHQFSGFLESGENFNRLRWRSTAQHTLNETAGNGSGSSTSTGQRTFRRTSVDFQPSYVITRWLTGLATVGYDDISSTGFNKNIDGAFWNGGFRLTPSERTLFELTYGRRYGNPNWSSRFNTTLDEGTTISFSYNETVETQSLAAQSRLGFLARGADGSLIDTRTGLPFTGRDGSFDQNDQTFLSKTFVASMTMPRDRNVFVLSAQYSIRDTEISQATTGPGRSDKTLGLTASWNHKLTPEMSSIATASFSDSRIQGGSSANSEGKNVTLRGQVALEYELNPSLKGTAGYAYIRRENTGAQFSVNEFTGKYDENVVFLMLRKTF
ncbi:MAG: TIGR03016 family PEP-CTERM system-associated outer membrane protein [Alphaproteobacteria bacterium]|nr:TIGR03016 family PEP-CTERM system-associated outer membrane protein [Alphaproteobacteria bacterium]